MSEKEPRAFIERARLADAALDRPRDERVHDFNEVEYNFRELALENHAEDPILAQAARCMNCGIPFCHGLGCPLGNLIPDWNAAVCKGDWRRAWNLLSSTSYFPEFTSRVCPALCEGSCTAGMEYGAVTIRQIEKEIVTAAFANGWAVCPSPKERNGKHAAVVGAGPSGLAAAVTLNKLGYTVTVYDRNRRPGGLLRYGIPDFKLNKGLVARRVTLMETAGIKFMCDLEIGKDLSAAYLEAHNDVIVVANGTPVARDLKIPGREAQGVHFALEFLGDNTRFLNGEKKSRGIDVRGKKVLVIGGGDTGSDCVGTSNREGAASVEQIEIMPKPPAGRAANNPWPDWPRIFKTTTSHEEGCKRRWLLNSLRFVAEDGKLVGVDVAPVTWERKDGKMIPHSDESKTERIVCDYAFLALGFLKRDRATVLGSLGFHDLPKAVIVGDAASGPSLVVRAIASGRDLPIRA